MLVKPEKPDLAFLSQVLRHPEEWPAGFKWDYCDCETCAIGMCAALWPEHFSEDPTSRGCVARTHAAQIMGYVEKPEVLDGVFYYANRLQGRDQSMKETTPDDVADVIDELLVKGTVSE
jgi:hypothetical protein